MSKKEKDFKIKCYHKNCEEEIVLLEKGNKLCIGCTFASKKYYLVNTDGYYYPRYAPNYCNNCKKKEKTK